MRASVIVESLIVFFVLLCCVFIFLPFDSLREKDEQYVVLWLQKYSEIQYSFDVVKAQFDSTQLKSSSVFMQRLKKILRIKGTSIKKYSQSFRNKKTDNSLFIFQNFYEAENGVVYGFKWLNPKCEKNDLCAIMSVDINGYNQPNVWGKDVYGINIFADRIEPIGRDKELIVLKHDCSDKGYGIYCSAYYLLGGVFVK